MQKAKSPSNANASRTSNAKSTDNFLVYLIAVVVLGLAAISLFVWSHNRKSDHVVVTRLTYSKFGPYQVEAQNYSIAASLSVQTDADDADWAKENQKSLDTVFKKLLADNVDSGTLKTPNGLQTLQDALAKGSNAALGTNRVRTVLLTDFTTQTRQ
jgi:flagellar basal body-associated protein FliL